MTSFLELGVQTVEGLEPLGEDFLVGQTLLGPAFEDLFNAESFDPMELVVFYVGIVNELSYSLHRSITNTEPLDQRFESAAVPVVTELHFEHIVGNCGGMVLWLVCEDEFGSCIDEPTDQPG
jgi:hypothetical protein